MFKRLFSKSLLAAGMCGIGVLALTSGPAGAAVVGAGAGVVDGSVTIAAPGVDTTPRITNYTFAPITLAGVMATSGGAYAGCITTSQPAGGFGAGIAGITWPQGGETVLGGSGNVSSFTFGPAACPGGAPNVGTLAGSCSSASAPLAGVGPSVQGGFLRVGSIVLVLLNCSVTTGSTTAPATIVVAAQFSPACAPPPGVCENGVTVPIQHASFVGLFAGAGASLS